MLYKFCGGCKLFDQPVDVEEGECYRFPPVPLSVMGIDGELDIQYFRPIVCSKTKACGDWDDAVEPNNTVSMILPWAANIQGRMNFEDWMREYGPEVRWEYAGESLYVYQDETTLTGQSGDRIFLSSKGVKIQ